MKTYGNLSCYEGHVLQWIRRSLQHSGENLKLLSTSIARQHSDSKFYQKAFSQTLSLTENDSKDVFFLLKDIYCHIKLSAILWTFRPLFEIVLWMVSPDTFNHLTCLSIQKSIKSAAEMFKWFVFDKNTTPNIHFATVSKFSTILDVVFSIEDYPDSTESSFNMNSLDEVSKKTEGIDSEKKTKNEQRKVYNNIKDTTNVTNNQIVQNNFDMKENSQSSFLTGPLLIEIGRQLVMTAFLYVTIQNQAAVGQVLYTVIKHWCFKHYSFSLFIIETNCFYSCKGTLSQGSMYNRDRPKQSQNDENTFNQLVEYIDDYFTISTGLPTSLTTISVLTRSLSYFCVPSQEFLLYESSQLTIRGLYFYFKLEGFLQSIFYKKKHTGYSLNHSTCFTPYIIGKWLWDCISYQSSGNAANALNENSSTVSSTTTIQNFKQNKNPLQDSLSYHITSEERKKNSIFFESHSGRTIVHPLLTVLLHSMSSFLSLFLTESKCYVLSSTCLEWIEFTFFQLKLHILKNHNTEKENPTPAENIFSFTFDMDDISILEKWLTLIDIGDKNKRDVVQNVLLLSKKITKKIETYYATLCQKTLIGRLLIMSGVEPQMLLYGLNNEIETVPLDKTSNFTFGVYKRNNLQSGFPDMMSSMQPLLFPLLGRQILETNLCFSCPPFSKKELPVSNLLLWIIGQAFKTVFFSFPLLLHKNSTSELKFCDA
ncbi:uncharacterized protein LOC128882518 isoform X2 [Hylaeus volcanicus]|uniref:uncharacterized protein LOC128882518 isoform X2 n=1 Tax=Hylaeus volcanicus TaxID=313075 RepID=UPI0023B851F7|nr:uncharacterized protein LOC128882518 isoform X2 [Hylaeus volcanicus]